MTDPIWHYPRARALANYDGDTVTLEIDVGLSTYRRVTVRLARVNTPEMKEAFMKQGLDPATSTPEAFAAFIRDEVAQTRSGWASRGATSRSMHVGTSQSSIDRSLAYRPLASE